MTGNTFGNYISTTYDTWVGFCVDKNIDLDLLNDVYLKSHDVLIRSGFTKTEIHSYIKKSLYNLSMDDKRKKTVRKFIEFNGTEGEILKEIRLEEALQFQNDCNDKTDYYNEVEFLARKLLQFIELYNKRGIFSDIEVFIFKSYVFSDLKYTEIEEKFNLKAVNCRAIMYKLRKIIKRDFINWINEQS